MPGSVLPDLSRYPWWTALLAVAMGALISPLCEQAGLWGYCQEDAERRWSGTTAIISPAFALGPPAAGAAFAPKALFFFLTGPPSPRWLFLKSILPPFQAHAGLFTFFVGVWPHDPERRLVLTAGTDAWFWIHVAQAVIFAALACWTFGRLARAAGPTSRNVRST
jgi:hypothetical protein